MVRGANEARAKHVNSRQRRLRYHYRGELISIRRRVVPMVCVDLHQLRLSTAPVVIREVFKVKLIARYIVDNQPLPCNQPLRVRVLIGKQIGYSRQGNALRLLKHVGYPCHAYVM